MNEIFLLPMLVLIPLVCGLAMAWLPPRRDELVRYTAFGVTLGVFVLSLAAAMSFDWSDPHGKMQMIYRAPWIDSLGIGFHLGVDAISLSLVLLTTFLMPITVLGSFGDVKQRSKEFYLWLLVLQAAMTGVFLAQDLILFYICFELTLVPLYFLIGIWGSSQRLWAAKKFFIYTLSGSLFTFAGVLYVAWYHASRDDGAWTFDIAALTATALQMPSGMQAFVLAALMAGFAIKVPLFPVHTWLPLAHTEAPTSGSVLLAGVLLKLGTYGLLRFAIPMAPEAVVQYAPCIAGVATLGILYAALVCWVQDDIKKLVAYSSVSHLGFCVLGMFALNPQGVGGSVMYMINHGISTGALFLCVGMIYRRYHTREMDRLSGLGKRLPIWSTFMVIFCLASVGLPGLNGFVGEFLTLLGAYTSDVLGVGFAAVAALGLILAAIYILYMVGRVIFGPLREPAAYAGQVKDLDAREIAVLTPLAIACLVLGLFPTPLLRSMEPEIANLTGAANRIVAEQSNRPSPFGAGDPAPQVLRHSRAGGNPGRESVDLRSTAKPCVSVHSTRIDVEVAP